MTYSVVVFQVDVFGACGKLTCTRDDEDACFNMLKQDYKFYLAFENSNCQYYITEKFFRNALMYVLFSYLSRLARFILGGKMFVDLFDLRLFTPWRCVGD